MNIRKSLFVAALAVMVIGCTSDEKRKLAGPDLDGDVIVEGKKKDKETDKKKASEKPQKKDEKKTKDKKDEKKSDTPKVKKDTAGEQKPVVEKEVKPAAEKLKSSETEVQVEVRYAFAQALRQGAPFNPVLGLDQKQAPTDLFLLGKMSEPEVSIIFVKPLTPVKRSSTAFLRDQAGVPYATPMREVGQVTSNGAMVRFYDLSPFTPFLMEGGKIELDVRLKGGLPLDVRIDSFKPKEANKVRIFHIKDLSDGILKVGAHQRYDNSIALTLHKVRRPNQ